MRIFRCIATNQLNQGFGAENTSPSSMKIYTDLGHLGHEGWDWGVKCVDFNVMHGGQCEQIYCDLDGSAVITEIQKDDNLGFGIVARSEDADGIFQHLWWHFDLINPDLKVGGVIESGDLLGTAGRTGRASGDHVHRELRPMARDTYGNVYKTQINNGYGGAVSMTPYFTNIFIIDYMDGQKKTISLLTQLINLYKQLRGK